MKKVFLISMILLLFLTLTGCSTNEDSNNSNNGGCCECKDCPMCDVCCDCEHPYLNK